MNYFVSRRDATYKISLNSEIKYRIDQIKYNKGEFVRTMKES